MKDLVRAPGVVVAAALDDVAAIGGFFALRVGRCDEGWRPVDHFYSSGFADLSTAVANRYRTTELRVGVSIAHLGHAARLWSPVLACVLLHGIVLDLSELQRADDSSELRLPEPAGWYADSLSDRTGSLYAEVMHHLDALGTGLRVKVAPRLLDGNAASALVGSAGVLLSAYPQLRAALGELVTDLLGRGRLVGTGHVTGPDLAFTRRSCCLYYRTPTGTKCGDCCFAS
ncbi:(2Fe-2S)-binding protein [Streptomyces sp. NPDC014623]|uniref:(2Fe-2S)-binding protein n=1 Tax=Streptomyces sp. NPDC014623 TaxID=3364875 RepID=UPI0037007D7D